MGGASPVAEFSSLMKSWTLPNTSTSVQLLTGGANPGPVLQAMAKRQSQKLQQPEQIF